jgi:transcriptional regulator with XRE-family HTH domain
VGVRSQGKFKPSVIGGYERGERALSLQRFCQIAELYHLPPDRLLAEAMTKLAPQGREELIIDLAALNRLVAPEARAVAEFVHRIRSERGDYLGEVITLRAGDLKQLSLASGKSADVLLKELQPAVRPT